MRAPTEITSSPLEPLTLWFSGCVLDRLILGNAAPEPQLHALVLIALCRPKDLIPRQFRRRQNESSGLPRCQAAKIRELAEGGLHRVQLIAAHESPRTTKLYDRTGDEITLEEWSGLGFRPH
jgi:hypothetical protein